MIIAAETSGAQASMTQLGNVTDRELKRAVNAIKPLADEIRKQERAAAQAAVTMKRAANDEAVAIEKVRSGHAGVNRELLVLGHELSQGNYKNFGGSLLVLGERMNVLEYATTAAGAATFGLGAAVLGVGALLVKSALDAEHFARALQLTGNYAGVTQEEITRLAQAQAKMTGQSVGGARGSLEAAAGSGLFGPRELTAAARAMGDYQKVTGATAEEALKNFERIKDGAAKWAEEQNRTVHFLTASQYEEIKALEESGDKQGAAVLALSTYAQTIESRGVPALGYLARAWHAVKDAASGAAEAIAGVGRPGTIEDAIRASQQRIRAAQRGIQGDGAPAFGDSIASTTAMQQRLTQERQQLNTLLHDQLRQTEQRAQVAADAEMAQAGIAAREAIDGLLKRAKATDALSEALKNYRAQVKAAADAGKPYTSEQIAAGEAQIRRDHTPAVSQGESEYRSLIESIKAYNMATDEEINGAATLSEAQRWEIERKKQLSSITQGLTRAQRAAAASAIEEASARRTASNATLDAQAKRNEELQQAEKARHQEVQAVVDFLSAADAEIAKVDEETAAIGKSTQERAALAAQMNLERLAREHLNAAGEEEAALLDALRQKQQSLAVSQQRMTERQEQYNSSFANGADKAFQAYSDAAKNNAALAESFVTSSMRSIEDAMVQTALTGKLNFKSLADSIIADFIRIGVQKSLAKLGGLIGDFLDSGSLGGVGASSSAGSAYSGGGSPAGSAAVGSWTPAKGYANGLDYVPYDGFPAILHEGEKVVRRQEAQKSSGATHFDFSGQTINVGQGVSRAEVQAAVNAGNAQTVAYMQRQMRTGRLVGA